MEYFNSSMSQELQFHGVDMSGPAQELSYAGSQGAWKHNIARDMLRQVGKIAPCQVWD